VQVPAQLLVVGLDAMEAPLVEQWATRGDLPTFATLQASAARHVLSNPMRTLPGAIWPEISTGRAAETLGLYFHPSQLRTGEPVPRKVEAHEVDASLDWWHVAGDAGRRILVLDVPHTVPRPGTNGIHIADWGNHDRAWLPASDPPDALAAARELVGDHPIGRCDPVVADSTPDAYRRLLEALLEGIDRRARLAEQLMGREHWDVAHVVFSESHCVGHQFWAFADPTHPVAIPDPPDDLRDAIRTVYRAIDAGLARLLAAAGPDASVMVVASHGMGPYIGGYQLLPEVLVRLGLRPRPLRLAAAPSRLPPRVRDTLRSWLPDSLRWRRLALAGTLPHHDLASPRTKATVLLNNRCGAIRLNLRGREPHGQVEPGTEADELIAMLRRELAALCDPRTGEPIVASTHTPEETAPAEPHPDLPDLVVAFRTDLGRLEACESPRVGRIDVPLWSRERRPDGWPVTLGRTGDHTAESRLWLLGPGIEPRHREGVAGSVRDVAPTALTLLGVPVPSSIEGSSLVDSAS
jgi:predicted AlkP superfamily phosphohydrolase/phosphomutase